MKFSKPYITSTHLCNVYLYCKKLFYSYYCHFIVSVIFEKLSDELKFQESKFRKNLTVLV